MRWSGRSAGWPAHHATARPPRWASQAVSAAWRFSTTASTTVPSSGDRRARSARGLSGARNRTGPAKLARDRRRLLDAKPLKNKQPRRARRVEHVPELVGLVEQRLEHPQPREQLNPAVEPRLVPQAWARGCDLSLRQPAGRPGVTKGGIDGLRYVKQCRVVHHGPGVSGDRRDERTETAQERAPLGVRGSVEQGSPQPLLPVESALFGQ